MLRTSATSPYRPRPYATTEQITRPGATPNETKSSPVPNWERLPNEIRENIVCHMGAQDLASFSATSKVNLALARSAQVITRQRPEEATRSLRRLAKLGATDTIRQLTKIPDTRRLDWGSRNGKGETLMMTALRQYSAEVIDALAEGPVDMFAGMDNDGDNILHYVVEHADAKRLDRLLTIHPGLAAYIDLPGGPRSRPYGTYRSCPPLDVAYAKRADALVDRLTAEPIEIIDHAVQIAEPPALDTPRSDNDRLTGVFPFDRSGLPVEGLKSRRCMSGFQPSRHPVRSRLALVNRAIHDGECMALDRLLATLPDEILRSHRENLIRVVMAVANFPSIRVIARHYGATMFAPLQNGETALHLATAHCGWTTVEWLLEHVDAAQALDWRDNAGRTPLLSAAKHASLECVSSLIDRCPDSLQINDVDANGHGLLHTLFRANPEMASWLFQRGLCKNRLTRLTFADKTATLAYAIRRLLESDQPGGTLTALPRGAFEAHLEIIKQLLSGQRDEIDVHAKISPTGDSIINSLLSDAMTRLVRQDKRNEQTKAIHTFEKSCITHNNLKSLSLVRAYLLRHDSGDHSSDE